MPGWIYFEPSPYNPATGPNSPNLQLGPANYPVSAPALTVDLTSDRLPLPRLRAHHGLVRVGAYTDLKLHDISATSDPRTDSECEPLDQNQAAGSPAFFAGNCKFITRKLWGFYNQGGAFMHHGKFTSTAYPGVGPRQQTLRQTTIRRAKRLSDAEAVNRHRSLTRISA